MMRLLVSIPLVLAVAVVAGAQEAPAPQESAVSTRFAISAIDDATFYGKLRAPVPTVLNRVLVEPTFSLRYRDRAKFSTSLVGETTTYKDTATQVHVKELYTGLSAGDFDLTAGRKMLRWGTGYAFTAAGVLDPPRSPADPGDRLNVNEGRDMVKVDWVRGKHALTAAWSTAALATAGAHLHDTTAIRYNVLVHGFDTSMVAGDDRGGDAFGGVTFTRVLGQAWELHGEGVWREQAAALIGAKCTLHSGVTLMGEFYTPPNTAYFRDSTVSARAGRQHYMYGGVSKTRLRELPGWKEWDVSGAVVTNLDDHSLTGIVDVSRWFGNHFSSYVHMEFPHGGATTDYGAAPYTTAASLGLRFQL
ncbi:MAG: hypothetical protein P4L40_12840 [Terracidiphilus sp.]|nr:hypothetical protein [Terracidiphilus sp.]